MTSILKVNSIQPQSGTTITFGSSGDTITISAGVTWSGSGASLTSLNATQLTSGTVPDARFPATLPAASGLNLTALNATQLTSGTLPDARFPATLPAISGANLTNLPAETKPTISSITPSVVTNAQTAITITGTNFVNTPYVDAINSSTGAIIQADSVAFSGATSIVATFTLAVDGTYFLRVENNDGNAVRSGTAILTVSDVPAWVTGAGSLGTFEAGASVGTITITCTDATSFARTSGALPGGLTLNTAATNATITGTESGATQPTTYNFTITATDAQGQTADRAFSIAITLGINNSARLEQ